MSKRGKYKHSREFKKKQTQKIHTDWKAYKKWVKEQRKNNKNGIFITDYSTYKEDYLSKKEKDITRVLDRQKYEAFYNTDYNNALSFKQKVKEDLDVDLTLTDIKTNTTNKSLLENDFRIITYLIQP